MAGHSHWANIARKKAVVDNKRGKLWSKLSKAIIVAAKMGGGDADMNLRLRYAIDAAKAVSMPKENIQRAIKSGIGQLDGTNFEEILYEGYGAGGAAVLCEILTDNRNRTAGEIRKIFELADGKLGATGCVAWMFERKGLFLVPADKVDEDRLLELTLEAGADDVRRVDDKFEITCNPSVVSEVSTALETRSIPVDAKQIARIPTSYVDLDAQTAPKVLALMERLDDHDDVQSVASNFNIPQEALADSKN
ncbi:MAG TPA: YebC/PmpR family DNA-binding transcriptional regulator [Pirellulales bacterium]|jgi:YebC/PmpR family DNA-binding regulatory protein|nr:YebC/PmpR family DNA-binding transcriptional regulator [Pirellulales bacterium]